MPLGVQLRAYSSKNNKDKTPPPPNTDRSNHPALPHLTPEGKVHMTSVASKEITPRQATADCRVYFTNPAAYELLSSGEIKKGDVFSAARLAGIMAAKRTPDIVPLCHPAIGITGVLVDLALHPPRPPARAGEHSIDGSLSIVATVSCEGRTGVEMEAMTAVMGAALTVYDMCKAVDKGMVIGNVKLLEKKGGKSGNWGRSRYFKRLHLKGEPKPRVIRYTRSGNSWW
jgi:molybdenum cofactor biosynthesis protein MoaC